MTGQRWRVAHVDPGGRVWRYGRRIIVGTSIALTAATWVTALVIVVCG